MKSWTDAQQHCINVGGHLMEVKAHEEFEKALQFRNELDDFWLGGNDIQDEGVWIWDSNDEMMNRNRFWENDQPNNLEADQHCLQMYSGGFNDRSCTILKSFVCEINSM